MQKIWRMNDIPTINIGATGRNIIRMRKAAGITVKELQAAIFGCKIDDIIVVDVPDDNKKTA